MAPESRPGETSALARIAIGLCGEGRGHAVRMCTLVERLGVPLVSLDHQHFLVAYDLGRLPPCTTSRRRPDGEGAQACPPARGR